MDNEELKKKIIDVLRNNREYELRYHPDDNYTEVVIDYEAIANALIAAGIVTDVQSLADGNCVLYVKDKGFMRLYNEQDINKMIHRAEVAESELERYKRALRGACKVGAAIGTEEHIQARVDCFLRQADREIKEEGRNV